MLTQVKRGQQIVGKAKAVPIVIGMIDVCIPLHLLVPAISCCRAEAEQTQQEGSVSIMGH